MSTPKLYMNAHDADLIIAAYPGMDDHIHVLTTADDLTFGAYTGLLDRLNQNLKEGKLIAPVKIREEKTDHWFAQHYGRG